MSTNPSPFGSGGQQAWQFKPESYGALGNGKVIGDGVTNGTTTFTSASAGFTPADTGKTIMINGGLGTAAQPLITTFTFVNATTVTLALAATATASGVSAVYGSDDTAAINACITAASTYAQANHYRAQVIFAAALYCLASGPTQSGNGTSTPTFNSQLPLPFPNANGSTQKLVLEFIGVGDASQTQYFQGTVPNLPATCLVSMVTPPASGGSATFGAQSVLGGPSLNVGFTGGFANVKAVISGICIVVGWGNQGIGFDFRFLASVNVPTASYQTMAAVLGNAPVLSTIGSAIGTNATGLQMPVATNNDESFVGQFTAEGCAGYGIVFSEHFNAQRLTLVYCSFGVGIRPTGGVVVHGASILYLSVEASPVAMQCFAVGGIQFPISIGLMDTEIISTWDIQDTSNTLTGVVYWADFERTTLNISGAGNLNIVNTRLNPGHWSAPPAVPASTVAQQNTAWRPASIVVHTGAGVTVSAITVDGTVTGLTIAASSSLLLPKLPSGRNVIMTYAGGTPTWDWWLD